MPIRNDTQQKTITDQRARLVSEAAKEHHVTLLHYVHGMTRQWQDAENIVQDLWRYVLLHFAEHNIKRRGVLFDKARKLVIDHYRAIQRKPAMGAEELDDFHMAKQSQELYAEEEDSRLKEHFFSEYPGLQLTDIQKEILWLHARYGFTYKEIKERTGHSISTIGDWIALGRRKLAEEINKGI